MTKRKVSKEPDIAQNPTLIPEPKVTIRLGRDEINFENDLECRDYENTEGESDWGDKLIGD